MTDWSADELRERVLTKATGAGSVAKWDQLHADALAKLRGASAFYLVVLDDGRADARAGSDGLEEMEMVDVLLAAATVATNMAERLAESVEEEAA